MNKMAEILNIDEIKSRYDGEWVLIGDPVADESLTVVRGSVLWHSKDRDAVYCKARELKPVHSAILFFWTSPQRRRYCLMTFGFDPSQGLIIVPVRLFGPAGDMIVRLALDTGATSTLINSGNHGPLGIRSNNIAPPNSGDHWERGRTVSSRYSAAA